VASVKTSKRNYSVHNRDHRIPARAIDFSGGAPFSVDSSTSFDGIPSSIEKRREVEQEKRRGTAIKTFLLSRYISIIYVSVSILIGAALQGWI